jgi:hypothetical protein
MARGSFKTERRPTMDEAKKDALLKEIEEVSRQYLMGLVTEHEHCYKVVDLMASAGFLPGAERVE